MMKIFFVNWLRIQSNTGKYGPEITPYLDTFNAVSYGIFPVPTNRNRLDLILSKHCRYCCTLENLICLNSEKFYHRVRKTYNLFTVFMLTLDVDQVYQAFARLLGKNLISTQTWKCITKLSDQNKRKMGILYFEFTCF